MISLSWDQVRAWRIANQHLRDGHEAPSIEGAARSALGIQAQVASCAEQALAVRVPGVGPADVQAALWERRTLVRTWAMRGTLHLLPAAGYPWMVAALSTRENWRSTAWQTYTGFTIPQLEELFTAVGEALSGRALTREELADAVGAEHGSAMRAALSSSWGSLLKPAAYMGLLCSGPSQGQRVTFQHPRDWLGSWAPVDPQEGLRWVVRRYLRAYGPATHREFGSWWGARAKMRPIFAGMRDELVEVDVEGLRLFANADDADELRATRPTRGAVRLLGGFDTYVMGSYPRDQVVREEFRPRVSRVAGWISPVVLVDGFAAGVWKAERRKEGMVVTVEPFGALSATVRRRIEREAARHEPCLGAIKAVTFAEGPARRASAGAGVR